MVGEYLPMPGFERTIWFMDRLKAEGVLRR